MDLRKLRSRLAPPLAPETRNQGKKRPPPFPSGDLVKAILTLSPADRERLAALLGKGGEESR
jgi:hypothetical protein